VWRRLFDRQWPEMRAPLTLNRPFTHEREIIHKLISNDQRNWPAPSWRHAMRPTFWGTDASVVLMFEITRCKSGERLLFLTSDGADYNDGMCVVMGVECSPLVRSIFFRFVLSKS
jgi:hypothetical protein